MPSKFDPALQKQFSTVKTLDEPNYEKIETSGESKIDKCKAFMKNYCLPIFALCWTILLFVGLGSK